MTAGQLFKTDEPITEFRREHRFLSNFWLELVTVTGPWWDAGLTCEFASVEHAFQAAKVEPATPGFAEHYERIAGACKPNSGEPAPGLAKQLGSAQAFREHGATLRAGWDQGVKVMVMLACLRSKFAPDANLDRPELNLDRRLIATSPRVLVEGNTWGDTYWGVCRGAGKNMLGRLLMLVRAELTCAAAAGMRVEELR